MGRLSIPVSDHRAIRRDRSGQFGVRDKLKRISAVIAVAATDMSKGGDYGVEETTGSDRTRINVWAEDHKAAKAESGAAPPLQRAAMQAGG